MTCKTNWKKRGTKAAMLKRQCGQSFTRICAGVLISADNSCDLPEVCHSYQNLKLCFCLLQPDYLTTIDSDNRKKFNWSKWHSCNSLPNDGIWQPPAALKRMRKSFCLFEERVLEKAVTLCCGCKLYMPCMTTKFVWAIHNSAFYSVLSPSPRTGSGPL